MAKSGPDLQDLASRLDQIVTNNEGNVGFEAIEFQRLRPLLEHAFDFLDDVPETARRRFANEAAFAAAKSPPITEKSLRSRASRLRNAYLKMQPEPYTLATSLSFQPFAALSKCSLEGTHFTFTAKLPERYSRQSVEHLFTGRLHDHLPKKYAVVRVRVKARSAFEAAPAALESLDYLRGIWNFRLNRGTVSRTVFGPSRPINSIVLGPIHTLHHVDGGLAAQSFWYEPSFNTDHKPHRLQKEWDKVRAEFATVRNVVSKSSYATELREGFVRYTRALDPTDHEASFLKLWSLLEFLTGTGNARYDDTIRRILFLYGDQSRERLILDHLRARRNATVHSSESSSHMESFAFQAKGFAETLLLFHLRHSRRFSSLSDAGNWLHLPSDPHALQSRIDAYKRALKFRQN